MDMPVKLLVFELEEGRYALNLNQVLRVVNAADVTMLPELPGIVLGVIEIDRQVVPVLNIRGRFGLKEPAISLSDHFIIARTSKRSVALIVDGAVGVIEVPAQDILRAKGVVPGVRRISGIVQLEDGMVLIHDLDHFLSLDEENQLEVALKGEHCHET